MLQPLSFIQYTVEILYCYSSTVVAQYSRSARQHSPWRGRTFREMVVSYHNYTLLATYMSSVKRCRLSNSCTHLRIFDPEKDDLPPESSVGRIRNIFTRRALPQTHYFLVEVSKFQTPGTYVASTIILRRLFLMNFPNEATRLSNCQRSGLLHYSVYGSI